MQTFFIYILLSTSCLSVTYLFYKALLEKRTTVKVMRFYFLIAMLVSMLAPLSPLSILQRPIYAATSAGATSGSAAAMVAGSTATFQMDTVINREQDIIAILFYIYCSITFFFIIRIGRELYSILACWRKAEKEKWGNLQIVWNHQYKGSFSFFHLVFLNKKYLHNGELDKVLAHEKVHATQYHSVDVLLMQLLVSLMWFNPLIWAMRNAMQLVHEYLADEGVLNTGIDKVQYQQSLLNHVAESALISFSSAFNHSLLKKRFLMMAAGKAAPATKYKILVLIPVTALMLLGIACVNGRTVRETPKVVTAVALTKMNVLYVGMENPVNISVSGYPANEMDVAIDNGTIEGNSGEYVIKPARPGKALITVSASGKVIRETEFKAKYIPDPVVALAPAPGTGRLIKGGEITKERLLKAGGIIVTVENSDLDLPVKIASFTISVITSGNMQVKAATSDRDRFSAAQVSLIQSLIKDQKIIFDDITAGRPDGSVRKMPASMVFTLKDQ